MAPDLMGRPLDHREIEDLLGAYALDAVDPDERAAVDAHLVECVRCRTEVDHHRQIAAGLGNDVSPLSAELWDRIAGQLTPRPARDDASVTAFPGTPGELARARDRRRKWRVRPLLGAAGAAAAVAAIAVLGASLAGTEGQLSQARQALDGTASRAAVQAALAVPGHQVARLRSANGSALAELVVMPNGRGYLTTSKMPALPAGRTYQLWAIFGSRPISLGLLGNRPTTASFTLASGQSSIAGQPVLAVTVEPAGGTTSPSGAPFASGSLRS